MTEQTSMDLERRKQYWTKEGLDRRRSALEKVGCDPEVLSSMKGDELVQACLIAEGLVAGQLPKKKETMPATVDPMTMMMQMLQQMKADSEQRMIESERKAEKFRIESEQKAEQMRLESERKTEQMRLESDRKTEQMRLESEQKAEQLRIESERKAEQLKVDSEQRAEEIRLEIKSEREQRDEQLRLDNESRDERQQTMLKEQMDGFAKLHDIKVAESRQIREDRLTRDNTKEAKIKTFGDLLKHVLFHMPQQLTEIPIYLDTVDRIYRVYEVPNEIKRSLLNPYLSTAARKLVVTLPAVDVADYDSFKKALLREFSLTPNKYRDLFWGASKRSDETHTQYATRLEALLKFYMNSRGVVSFQDFKSLIIADKIKSGLTQSILLEVNKKEYETFLRPHDLAIMADLCVTNEAQIKSASFTLSKSSNTDYNDGSKHSFIRKTSRGRCFSCSSTEHYASSPECPNFKISHNQNNSDATKVRGSLSKQQNEQTYRQNTMYTQNSANNATGRTNKRTNYVNSDYEQTTEQRLCTFCGKTNHNFIQCYERKKGIPCKFCSRLNHASNMCVNLKIGR